MNTDVAISYPYTVSPYGVVSTTTLSSKIYLDRVLTLLSTSVGQRPMLPTYGVDWHKSMFEHDGDAQTAIQAAIRTAIAIWIPAVKVDRVDVQYSYSSGVESVQLSLILPDSTLISVPINTAIISIDGFVS